MPKSAWSPEHTKASPMSISRMSRADEESEHHDYPSFCDWDCPCCSVPSASNSFARFTKYSAKSISSNRAGLLTRDRPLNFRTARPFLGSISRPWHLTIPRTPCPDSPLDAIKSTQSGNCSTPHHPCRPRAPSGECRTDALIAFWQKLSLKRCNSVVTNQTIHFPVTPVTCSNADREVNVKRWAKAGRPSPSPNTFGEIGFP